MRKLRTLIILCLSSMCLGAQEPVFVEEQEQEQETFVVVEQMPEYPGGQQALFKFLSENVHYPKEAKDNGIQGRVICSFVVDKDGTVRDVEVVRSGGSPLLDDEAARVISLMPKWKPGVQRGKPVRVKYTVPVNFRLPSGSSVKTPPAQSVPEPSSQSDKSDPLSELKIQSNWTNETAGDRLFIAGRYQGAAEYYRQALSDTDDKTAINQKIATTLRCDTLLQRATVAEKAASSANPEKYSEAALLYMELFSHHGLPVYEERAKEMKKRAQYFTAQNYVKEGDDLFGKGDYHAAMNKYQQANRVIEMNTFAQDKMELALTCAKLLELAEQEERETQDLLDPAKYYSAYKLYSALYEYHPLPQYQNKIKQLKTHTKNMGVENQAAQFPGGEDALFRYIENVSRANVKPGAPVEEILVSCRFVVSEKGEVNNVEVVQASANDSLNQLAVQTLQSMPKWNPGRRNGRPAPYSFIIPITFALPTQLFVDLGLPSGLKWGTMNIGAQNPYQVGNHYQWGCLGIAFVSTWKSYCHGRKSAISKYCTDVNYGAPDGLVTLEPKDDIAATLLGEGWRMPTREEAKELWDNCTLSWEQHGEVSGYRFTGPNGNSIFLPANGTFDPDGLPKGFNEKGYYWTSSLNQKNNDAAYLLFFQTGGARSGVFTGTNNRHHALGIRPVLP